jgi:hypothetical protein
MFRLKIFKMIFLVMLFFLALKANEVAAQDGCIFPTVTEEVNFSEGWHDCLSDLTIICAADGKQLGYESACDEVTREDCVLVYIGGAPECAPYSWTISGTGFHFNAMDGPTTRETASTNEEVLICADNTACGTGKITVKDACWGTGTNYVRSDNSVQSLCYKKKGTMCYWDSCCNFVVNGHLIHICNCGSGSSWQGCTTGDCGDGFTFEACWPDLPDECSIPLNNGMWKFYIYVWTCP